MDEGSESGKFSAATIIDEAFLERFTITVEQPFAPVVTEEKILMNHMNYILLHFYKLDLT